MKPIAWRAFAITTTALLLALPAVAKTVLITGSNSGIGLEFARQYADDGWQVIATHRRDGIPRPLADLSTEYNNVRVEFLDVTDHASIDQLAGKLEGVAIDVLLNNAGIVGAMGDPDQAFGTLDYGVLEQFLRTNTVGPLKMAEAFYEHVRSSEEKKIVGISAIAASFDFAADRAHSSGIGFRYAYAMSKTALNMAYVGLANDTREDGVVVGLLHPGLVRVARTEQYRMTPELEAAMQDAEVAVSALRRVIGNLTMEDSGSFLGYDGNRIAW